MANAAITVFIVDVAGVMRLSARLELMCMRLLIMLSMLRLSWRAFVYVVGTVFGFVGC